MLKKHKNKKNKKTPFEERNRLRKRRVYMGRKKKSLPNTERMLLPLLCLAGSKHESKNW